MTEKEDDLSNVQRWTTRRPVELHQSPIIDDEAYRDRVSRVAQEALAMVS